MRSIWSFWFVIVLLILAILYFSIGIVTAAEYQCHVLTDTGIYMQDGSNLRSTLNQHL
jgi:hypothetical protein